MGHVKLTSALILALMTYPAVAPARSLTPLNDWQRTVVDIGRSITEQDQSGSAWIVEYNSSFPATDIGLVLAPASYDKHRSSLNVIAVCAPASQATILTEGRDYAVLSASRTGSFNANASPPPGFVGGSLAAANAALSIDKTKEVSFSLSDTSVKQIPEGDAIEAVNARDCLRRIGHRRDVFYDELSP